MKRLFIIHVHEKSEGSRIVAAVPATGRGRRIAKHLKAEEESRASFRRSCDVVEIEEVQVRTSVPGPKIPHGKGAFCGNDACKICLSDDREGQSVARGDHRGGNPPGAVASRSSVNQTPLPMRANRRVTATPMTEMRDVPLAEWDPDEGDR